MNNALVEAIKERIKEGYTEASVAEEMVAVGYTTDEARAAYAAAQASLTSVPEAGLPDIGDFLATTWHLCRTERQVLGKSVLLGVGAFVAAGITVFIVAGTLGFSVKGSFVASMVLMPVLAMLAGAIMSFGLMRALLLRGSGELFRSHVLFALGHFIPLTIVTIYMTIITQVGYALFIIPGIMAAVYLLFAIPVTLRGVAQGLGALTESVRLVYGRFLPVLARFVVMNLAVIAFGSLCLVIVGLSTATFALYDPAFGVMGIPLLIAIIISVVVASVYWLSCGTVVLYETLERVPSSVVPSPRSLGQLRVFFMIIIGLVVTLLGVLAFGLGFAGYAFLNW